MASPHISVIIPTYRAAATLPEAIASVQAQNFNDLEILVVDDGSPDDTLAIARQIACDDPRIRIFSQKNAGPAQARNRGIAKARGEIFAFLDADDAWVPELLVRHLAFLRSHAQCGVSFARICFFDPDLRVPGRLSAHVPQLTLARVLGENPVCTTSNIVARRTVFTAAGNFDEGLTHGEDQEWLARVLAMTPWTTNGLPDVLVKYRTSLTGLSADLARTRDGWAAMLEKVRGYAPDAVAGAEAEATALFHRYLARRALRTGQGRSAARPMMHALAANPAALLTHQPHRTFMTLAATLAAFLPGDPIRRLVSK